MIIFFYVALFSGSCLEGGGITGEEKNALIALDGLDKAYQKAHPKAHPPADTSRRSCRLPPGRQRVSVSLRDPFSEVEKTNKSLLLGLDGVRSRALGRQAWPGLACGRPRWSRV